MLYTDNSSINVENIPLTPTAIYITNNIKMLTNRGKRSCKKMKIYIYIAQCIKLYVYVIEKKPLQIKGVYVFIRKYKISILGSIMS